MFEYKFDGNGCYRVESYETVVVSGSSSYWVVKRILDIAISIILLPVLLIVSLFIMISNLFLNKGTLFYVQNRMGRDCKPFSAFKFRSMSHVSEITRGHNDPIEAHRITPFGSFLRKTRLDELPQIINVLLGQMSLIGPRPDYLEHAKVFVDEVPGYRSRHSVRPGISGLAQVNLGYVEGLEATRKKTSIDRYYIENAGLWLDAKILVQTLYVIALRSGAK